jgi:hypothetical protein
MMEFSAYSHLFILDGQEGGESAASLAQNVHVRWVLRGQSRQSLDFAYCDKKGPQHRAALFQAQITAKKKFNC